ncbi:MAG TPA: helix-turn-helix domain-containing protein [Xanthobacteraceae bacterium]|nr:helix-turn-helix domain-containing protein [Xanthobacteraceae bacterium]
MYAEHLIDVGRRSALERVAHFLLELLTRLQAIGLADERSFQMPLTQELIGDALGLSVPHVSRTLRQLREDDLVAVEGQRVRTSRLSADWPISKEPISAGFSGTTYSPGID